MMILQEAVFSVSEEQQQRIPFLRSMVTTEYPVIIRALRLIDTNYQTTKRPRGFNLLTVKNKKLDFVYYVRYYHDGKMLPSKWCTHTNSYDRACEFALKNREAIITRYLEKNGGEAEQFFRNFYDSESSVFQEAFLRDKITEERRKKLKSIIEHKFIPFLRERKISSFEEITTVVLGDFQDCLLQRGIVPYVVNDQMVAVTKVFKYLIRKGIVQNNPCLNLDPLPEKEGKGTHGCYEIDLLKGVFNKEWNNAKFLLLNMLNYTTNMRNIEIQRFRKEDIVSFDECRFIDIKKTKTENGVRLVPLHKKVYEAIIDYAQGMGNDEPIFADTSNSDLRNAYRVLGEMIGFEKSYLKENKITFCSGRHFWKTLMSSEGLGEDAEEVFMGHKVTSNVKNLYNHRDKQGKNNMVKKARQVFEILDRCIFDTEP